MVTLVGLIAPHDRLAGTVSVMETVPENAPTAATVIVDVADVPTVTAAGDVAVIVKSLVKLNETTAVWLRVPLVPVMLTE